MKMIRVTRKQPCPACGKPDWCMIGERGVLCMRQECAHVMTLSDGSAGWFHAYDEPMPKRALVERQEPNLPRPNFASLICEWSEDTDAEDVEELAKELGVTSFSIGVLGACYSPSHDAWAFPMSDERGAIIGIRLRFPNGSKRAVLGSRNGLFIPDMTLDRRIYICEGPTDTAAAISLGLSAVGRPSCNACGAMLAAFVELNGVREAVILADNDKPGISGAVSLTLPCPSVVALTPTKDVREFVRLGGTKAQLENLVNGAIWSQPK